VATFYIQLLNPCDYGFLAEATYARSVIIDFGRQPSAVIVYQSNSRAGQIYELARNELGSQGWITGQESDKGGYLHNAGTSTAISIKLRSPQGYFVKHDGPIIIVSRRATLMDRIRCWLEEKPWRR